jgi:hypothetical protein
MAQRSFGTIVRRPVLGRLAGYALMLGVVVIVAVPEVEAMRALADRLLNALSFRA